jgi:hypothetical protein
MSAELDDAVPRVAPLWGRCPLESHAHAVDIDAYHPYGVYVARCGHRLLMGTTLHSDPHGQTCPDCARWVDR